LPDQQRTRALSIIASGHWRSAAACRSADPELFFPISNSGKSLEQIAKAKAICAGCQVQAECLAFALRTQQAYGIWGGVTEEERTVAGRRSRLKRGEHDDPAAARPANAGDPKGQQTARAGVKPRFQHIRRQCRSA
jgi:WhiB family transcriptional regulator, redox-sensing transcriptional regulator